MQEVKNLQYYSSGKINSILDELSTQKTGLSSEEAERRLKEQGHNILVEKKQNIFFVFLSQFKSPLILLLLIAAIISFFIQNVTEGIIILFIMLLGVMLDFFQEYSANKAMIKLLEAVEITATVIRDGKKKEISMKNLVVGDMIFLTVGDIIPADARIISSENFFINQASMTGESLPAEKNSEKVDSPKSILDLNNILFSGTYVIGGEATALVLKTGKTTESGKIAEKIAMAPVESNFEKGTSKFGFLLMKITVALVVVIFLVNSFLKHEFLQSLIFALAIAVGITPDLLPAIMSITMAVGSRKMSKKGVIIKKLSSIPNLGSMNILCTDKTGTLTENKIVLTDYINFLGKKDEDLLNLVYLNSTFQTGIRNPLDDAVIAYKKINTKGFKKISEIPYDFFRKRMSVIVKKDKETIMITKGAPEEMLDHCSHYKSSNKILSLDKKAKLEAMKKYDELSNQGLRVLAVGTKKIEEKKSYNIKDEDKFVFEGFVSFYDPPKKDVEKTIKEMWELGIEIKVITGDNELVAERVAKEVGLEVHGIMLGGDIDNLSDDALKNRATKITIFARCSPYQKSRIVSVLRSANNVVGYLGDGRNDAPAIKNSDVGISVNNAVDIAKESANIILTRKSLSDLKEGVIDGRKTFGNTIKYMMMATSSNFGNIFTVSVTSFFLPFLPIPPTAILFSNLIYDASLVTIPSDKVDKDWLDSPKKWDVSFLKKFMYVFGPLSSVFDFITFAILLFLVKASIPVFQTAWFLESFATQILVFHFIRTKGSVFKSLSSIPLLITTFAGVIICWVTPFTYLGKLLGLVPVPLYLLPLIILINVVYFTSVEIAKKQFYKRNKF